MCTLSSFGRRRGRASILKSRQLQMYVVIKMYFNDKSETASKVLFEKSVLTLWISKLIAWRNSLSKPFLRQTDFWWKIRETKEVLARVKRARRHKRETENCSARPKIPQCASNISLTSLFPCVIWSNLNHPMLPATLGAVAGNPMRCFDNKESTDELTHRLL